MSQLPEPTDPRQVRASDTDRHRVADLLRDAAAEGRLSLEELDERLDGVFAAKTYAELEPYVRDLPVGAGSPNPLPSPARHPDRMGGTPGPSVSIAIMSGAVRKGPWVVPDQYTAVAFCGGVELDLREARFSSKEIVIRAFAMMGGVEIVVPEDVDISVDGVGIMGGFEDSASTGRTEGVDRPFVRVTGLAFWGGVSVKRKPPKPKAIEKDHS